MIFALVPLSLPYFVEKNMESDFQLNSLEKIPDTKNADTSIMSIIIV